MKERYAAIATAAGVQLNDEATILLNGLDQFDAKDPLVQDMRASVQRCVWLASGMLNLGARGGTGVVRASVEYLLEKGLE